MVYVVLYVHILSIYYSNIYMYYTILYIYTGSIYSLSRFSRLFETFRSTDFSVSGGRSEL